MLGAFGKRLVGVAPGPRSGLQGILVSTVLIAGAGPGGAALAFLLARRGAEVILLERHTDFAREFRGEVLLPGGLDVVRQMGLWGAYADVPKVELRSAALYVGGRRRARLHFDPEILGDLPPHWVSQPSFLEMLVQQAGMHPSFRLERGVTVRDLLRDDGRVVGVRAVGPEGEREYRADLVIGADGRSSVVRKRAGLPVRADRVPMDIVWFKLPLPAFLAEDPHARVYVGDGHLLLLASVYDGRLQIAWIIPKGGFGRVRERGMGACIDAMAELVSSDLAEHLRATGADAMDPFLLSTASDRVEEWSRPGLLVIGDAAHTMSPVGGQGLNIALRDAAVAANRLVPVLPDGRPEPGAVDAAARAIEQERDREVREIQRLQARAPRILFSRSRVAGMLLTLGAFLLSSGLRPPLVPRIAGRFFFGVSDVRLRV